MGLSFSTLVAVARFSLICTVLFAARAIAGCKTCEYDDDDLPVVRCDPVPAGSRGCVGLPGEPEGTTTKTYPPACEVLSAPGSGKCGYTSFVCYPAPDGGKRHYWVTDL